jgi:hypothetical protein
MCIRRIFAVNLKPAPGFEPGTYFDNPMIKSYGSGKDRNLIRSRLHQNPFCSTVIPQGAKTALEMLN